MNNQEIIPHSTISSMVDTWQVTQAKILNCFTVFNDVEERLQVVFGDHSYIGHTYTSDHTAKQLIDDLRASMWRAIIGKTEIKKFLTSKRIKELDESIHSGKIGEITVENVLNLFRSASANINTLLEEKIQECFNILHPYNSRYENNRKFSGEIGKKVVLKCLTHKYTKGFDVSHWSQDDIRTISNAFRLLDGKPDSESYYGDLYDAINKAEDGIGETDYFKFRCYHNLNLHIEFKRMDLVKKMNAMVTKNVLRKAV